MATRESIRGKVARVLTTRDLVINRGKKDGVSVGMKFVVVDPAGENVKDPDTGEVLGSIRRPKARVKVVRVEDRLSLARTYRTATVNLGGTGGWLTSNFAASLVPPRWVTKYETFLTDEASWRELEETKSIVKTGDPVEELSPTEEELDEETAEEEEEEEEEEGE